MPFYFYYQLFVFSCILYIRIMNNNLYAILLGKVNKSEVTLNV